MSDHPYADRFLVNRTLPEHGRNPAEILAELAVMSEEEDRAWEGGKISGTMYCGDHGHYAFLTEAFGKFAHVNALQHARHPRRQHRVARNRAPRVSQGRPPVWH